MQNLIIYGEDEISDFEKSYIKIIKTTKDPYVILNVTMSATDEQIKKSYKNLCKKYHPDIYKDSELFKIINEAYNKIKDSDARLANSFGFENNEILNESIKKIINIIDALFENDGAFYFDEDSIKRSIKTILKDELKNIKIGKNKLKTKIGKYKKILKKTKSTSFVSGRIKDHFKKEIESCEVEISRLNKIYKNVELQIKLVDSLQFENNEEDEGGYIHNSLFITNSSIY